MTLARPTPTLPVRDVVTPRTESIGLALANSFDNEAISLWLRDRGGFSNVTTMPSPAVAEQCRKLRRQFDVLILDATSPDAAAPIVREVCDGSCAKHVLLLDDRPRDARIAAVLTISKVSYLSRQAGPDEFLHTLNDILKTQSRVFDPAVVKRIRRTRQGLKLTESKRGVSIAQLSARERQVMRRLASGASVPETAEELGLSPSTVDNHRSRLMKKLDIHKATELTRRAFRDGLLHM